MTWHIFAIQIRVSELHTWRERQGKIAQNRWSNPNGINFRNNHERCTLWYWGSFKKSRGLQFQNWLLTFTFKGKIFIKKLQCSIQCSFKLCYLRKSGRGPPVDNNWPNWQNLYISFPGWFTTFRHFKWRCNCIHFRVLLHHGQNRYASSKR